MKTMTIDSSGNHHASAGTPTGGRFVAQPNTESANVTLTAAPALPDPLEVSFADIELGDEILGGQGESWGFTVAKRTDDGIDRVILHQGSKVRLDDDSKLTVRRRTEPLDYVEGDHDYWKNVAAIRDPRQTVHVLAHAVDVEAEDDFMAAIAEHPNATGDIIDKAARHNGTGVRRAALRNPKTWMETLWRIRREADEAAEQETALMKAEGINPNTTYRQMAVDDFRMLAAEATERIASAGDRR